MRPKPAKKLNDIERNYVQSGCNNKRRYSDELTAIAMAEIQHQVTYRCWNCKGWHLSSQVTPSKLARMNRVFSDQERT